MSQADRGWADGGDEMSGIHATLRQQRDEFAGRAEAGDMASAEAGSPTDPQNAVLLLPPSGSVAVPAADWDSAIQLVEGAAARIKAYERKFKAIETEARAFMDRVDVEQRRLASQITGLESDLRRAEDRASAAEADVQAMKLETWEAKLSRRNAEKKLTDAELEIRTTQQYLGQIESILQGL